MTPLCFLTGHQTIQLDHGNLAAAGNLLQAAMVDFRCQVLVATIPNGHPVVMVEDYGQRAFVDVVDEILGAVPNLTLRQFDRVGFLRVDPDGHDDRWHVRIEHSRGRVSEVTITLLAQTVAHELLPEYEVNYAESHIHESNDEVELGWRCLRDELCALIARYPATLSQLIVNLDGLPRPEEVAAWLGRTTSSLSRACILAHLTDDLDELDVMCAGLPDLYREVDGSGDVDDEAFLTTLDSAIRGAATLPHGDAISALRSLVGSSIKRPHQGLRSARNSQ